MPGILEAKYDQCIDILLPFILIGLFVDQADRYTEKGIWQKYIVSTLICWLNYLRDDDVP